MAQSDYQYLAAKAKSGDRASLEKLVNVFHEDVFRMVYYRTRSRMDAEDLTQEIFTQMLNNLKKLKDPAKFKSWLFRIALNRVRDFHRKKKIFTFLGTAIDIEMDTEQTDINSHDNPVNHVMQKEFFKRFHDFSSNLPRWEKEVFMLRFLDNMAIKEIAHTLKKSESTIKTHLYRALKKFRQNSEFRDLLKGEAA